MEKVIGMAEAKSKLAEMVGQVAYGRGRFILQRRGRPMAVIISVEEYERLKELAGTSAMDAFSPFSSELLRRQEERVARARRLEAQMGDPLERLAQLLSTLPPDDDPFWVDIHGVC